MGQAKFCQFAALRDHGYVIYGEYPNGLHFLTILLQPAHNCAIPTVKELRKGILTRNKGIDLQKIPPTHPQF